MWDPGTYLRYGDERARPFADLLARVGAASPGTVVDLGCGPGTLTVTLAQRWPDARISGVDSSHEMIDKARSLRSTVDFTVGDVRQWTPESTVDVVVSNATLQWVPDHGELLTRWARHLTPGSWLAVQVPGNFDAPSHRALRRIAAEPHWRDRLAHLVRTPEAVLEPSGYAALMMRLGFAVDAWETTYLHLLSADPSDDPTGDPSRDSSGDSSGGLAGAPSRDSSGAPSCDLSGGLSGGFAEHPVLRWMEGTALRPVHAALADTADWATFRQELRAELADAYPVRDGVAYFPFRRVFFVAHSPLKSPT